MKEFAKKPVFTFIAASLFNIAIVFILGIYNCTDDYFERFAPGFFFTIVSIVFIIADIAGCVVLRRKRMKNVLKGLFLYQLVGILSSVLYLIFMILGTNGLLDVSLSNIIVQLPHYIFSWWSVALGPLATLIARFLGAWNYLIISIMWYALAYFTGSSILGIKKDDEFREKVEDSHLADRAINNFK